MKGTALAPSQYVRSMLGKTRTSRVSLATVVVLAATLALSACGTQQAGAAAIIDGKTVSDKDVQTVSTQLNMLAKGQQQLTPSVALLNLILAPYVLAEAERAGKGVPRAGPQGH